MSFKQPFYFLRLKSENCGFMLAVNGCLIEEERNGHANSMEYPINQWIKNGENTFDFHHRNIPTPDNIMSLRSYGIFSLELCVRENTDLNSTVLSRTVYDGSKINRSEGRFDISDIENLLSTLEKSTPIQQFDVVDGELCQSDDGAYSIGDYQVQKGVMKSLQITQKITLPAPFPLWSFFEADDLTYHADLSTPDWKIARQQMINEIYQPVWQALHDKDSVALKSLFAERGREYDQAFYKREGADVYEMVYHLLGLIQNEELEPIEKIVMKGTDIAVSFNHKLSWLHKTKSTLDSKLKFRHKDCNLVTLIPIMFARFDGEWKIVR